MREFDRYYARVLSEHTTRVLVDASNVARYEKNRYGKGQIRFLTAMREELRRRNCFPIRFIADASLPYNLDHPNDLLAMVKRGEVELTASGQEADEILAREARRSGAFVVTNDRTFHHKVSPGFEPPRVAFQFFDRHVVVDDF
jgi:RNase P/RNase MRP subunit p30